MVVKIFLRHGGRIIPGKSSPLFGRSNLIHASRTKRQEIVRIRRSTNLHTPSKSIPSKSCGATRHRWLYQAPLVARAAPDCKSDAGPGSNKLSPGDATFAAPKGMHIRRAEGDAHSPRRRGCTSAESQWIHLIGPPTRSVLQFMCFITLSCPEPKWSHTRCPFFGHGKASDGPASGVGLASQELQSHQELQRRDSCLFFSCQLKTLRSTIPYSIMSSPKSSIASIPESDRPTPPEIGQVPPIDNSNEKANTVPTSAWTSNEAPDGGVVAWLVVFGAWCTSFCSFGWINSMFTSADCTLVAGR